MIIRFTIPKFRRVALTAGLILCSVLLSYSTSQAKSTDTLTMKQKEIRTLINKFNIRDLMLQTIQSQVVLLRKQDTAVPAEFWNMFEQEARDSIESYISLLVPIYNKYYTLSEIRMLNKLYDEPILKKSVQMSSLISQESKQIGFAWGQQLGRNVTMRMQALHPQTAPISPPPPR